MKLNYFSHLRDFFLPELDANAAAKARKELLKTLNSFKLKVPAATLSDGDLAKLKPHVLFAWMHDKDLSVSLFAIPEEKLDAELGAALETARNKTFTRFEIAAGDERGRAFQRIEEAMNQKALAKYRVAYFEDGEEPDIKDGALDKRFVAAHAVRRAQ